MILRQWTGHIRTADLERYREYLLKTGLQDYRSTPGNLAAQLVARELREGTTEIRTLSWWRSRDDILGFAGEDFERAVYYPEDRQFLTRSPRLVEHRELLWSSPPLGE